MHTVSVMCKGTAFTRLHYNSRTSKYDNNSSLAQTTISKKTAEQLTSREAMFYQNKRVRFRNQHSVLMRQVVTLAFRSWLVKNRVCSSEFM